MNVASSSRTLLLGCTRAAPIARLSSASLLLRRSFATEAEIPTSSAELVTTNSTTQSTLEAETQQWKKEGRLRPQRKSDVQVDPNHPLYAFFRRDMSETALKEDAPKYLPFEPYWATQFESGRPWTARELKRKSFKDLHVLWYVLARERNLLATQRQTVARFGMKDKTRFSYPDLDTKCRTTMTRIKQVLNERRLAYLGAAKLLANAPPSSIENPLSVASDASGTLEEPVKAS